MNLTGHLRRQTGYLWHQHPHRPRVSILLFGTALMDMVDGDPRVMPKRILEVSSIEDGLWIVDVRTLTGFLGVRGLSVPRALRWEPALEFIDSVVTQLGGVSELYQPVEKSSKKLMNGVANLGPNPIQLIHQGPPRNLETTKGHPAP